MKEFERTEMLFGKEEADSLKDKKVLVFGVGGVGGYVCESLARCGVGTVDIVDNDTVSLTNINRQIIALHSTVGRLKTDVMRERMEDINPQIKVRTFNCFFSPETSDKFDFSEYDYIVDAIDTVSGKVELVCKAEKENTPIISSMGTGNKTDPTLFKVSDIYKTSYCPLAKVMREKLREKGIKKLKVVYSEEEPRKIVILDENSEKVGKHPPASCAFVPSVAGFIISSEIIKDLIKKSLR